MRTLTAKVEQILHNNNIMTHQSYQIKAKPITNGLRTINLDLLTPYSVQTFNKLKLGQCFTFTIDENNYIRDINAPTQRLRARLLGLLDRYIIDSAASPRYEVITNSLCRIYYEGTHDNFYNNYGRFINSDVTITYYKIINDNIFVDVI